MRKSFSNENGNTLLLVVLAVMLVSIIVIPLTMMSNTSFLQTQSNAKLVQATAHSESAIRVLKRMFSETGFTQADELAIRGFVDELDERLFTSGEFAITPATSGIPTKITINSSSGVGSILRSKELPLIILRLPSAGGGGGGSPADGPYAGSTGEEFYYDTAVVVNNPVYNQYFNTCGNPNTPKETFIDNEIPVEPVEKEEFLEEFNNFISYYTDRDFSNPINGVPTLTLSERPQVRIPDAVPAVVTNISNEVTQSDVTISNSGTYTGLKNSGNMTVSNNSNSKQINANSNGVAIEANGNLNFNGWIGENALKVDGDILVGRNFTVGGMAGMTINGNVYVRGNLDFTANTNLTINGNLYVNGNLSVSSISNFTVNGAVIVGGSSSFQSGNIQIRDKMSSAGAINFTGMTNQLVIGQWSGNTVTGSDNAYLVAGGAVNANRIVSLKIPKDFSAYSFTGLIVSQLIKGSFLTQSDVVLTGSVTSWSIQQHLSVGGKLELNHYLDSLHVGGHIYAVTSIKFSGLGSMFNISGSMYTTGSVVFANSINGLVQIGGDLIANGNISFPSITTFKLGGHLKVSGNISFNGNIDRFEVGRDVVSYSPITFVSINLLDIGGSLISTNKIVFGQNIVLVMIDGNVISKGEISFATIGTLHIGGTVAAENDITFTGNLFALNVGGNLLTAGDISFDSINTELIVDGILGAAENVSFTNYNIAHSTNELGGFYAGGETYFHPNIAGNEEDFICINYQSPPSGGGGGSGIEFGT